MNTAITVLAISSACAWQPGSLSLPAVDTAKVNLGCPCIVIAEVQVLDLGKFKDHLKVINGLLSTGSSLSSLIGSSSSI